MNEEINPENMRIHSRADELIACLEGEIAKRDARIAEMQERFDSSAHRTSLIGRLEIENDQLRAELAAIKAQEPIAWYTEDHLDDKSATTYSWTVAERWVEKGWPVSPLYAAPVSEAKAQGVVMPDGWIPLTIEHEPGYPEDVAFGPKRMMDRLKKWLDRYFEMRLNAAPVQKASVPDDFVCDSKPLQELLNATAMLLETPCPDSATYWAAQLANVEQLLAAPAAPAADGWISVSERLPGEDDQVLCWCEDETVAWAEVSSHHNSFFTDMTHELLPVTHWMPLPAAPAANSAKGVV